MPDLNSSGRVRVPVGCHLMYINNSKPCFAGLTRAMSGSNYIPSQPRRRGTTTGTSSSDSALDSAGDVGGQQTAASRWHPKLTPYRLTFLCTTIGLGTAKVITTFRGEDLYVPITLEWISSVVVFLS